MVGVAAELGRGTIPERSALWLTVGAFVWQARREIGTYNQGSLLMVLFKSAVAALASVALVATPALAQAAPAKGTVMAKVSTVRAGADAKDGNHLNGSGTI